MAYNPFDFFRRNQKLFFAGLALESMAKAEQSQAMNAQGLVQAEREAALFHLERTGPEDHFDALAIQCCELLAHQSLVHPNGLEQPFRRRPAVLPQQRRRTAAQAPLRVEIGSVHFLSFPD